jgi:hypothetical protein
VNRANKLMFACNALVLGLVVLGAANAAPSLDDLKVNSITVGDGENKVVIAANESMTGLAVHRGRETVALLGLDGDGEPSLSVSGYLKGRGATFTSPGSFGSVAIASNSFASGVWVQETTNRFAALTAVKDIGPALEVSSGKAAHEGDEFAVSFKKDSNTPTIQILGTDGELHFIEANRLSLLEGKARPKTPKPE